MAAALPVLAFHAVDDRASVISFAPLLFRRALGRLRERGYRALSLPDAAGCLFRLRAFPDRSLAITFDDGYRSVYDEAFPILQECGVSATVFLTVGDRTSTHSNSDRLPSLQDRPMLSWGEIREMARWGMQFGAHTLTHPDLTRLPAERARAEIVDSKAIIEDALGAPVTCFAYPFGCFDLQSREIAREHFACACSTRLGLVTAGSDSYALERVDACYLRATRLFDLTMTGFLPWYLRALNLGGRLAHVWGKRPPC